MSKWTELRDSALEQIKQNTLDVTETAKNDFLKTFSDSAYPVVEAYADSFCETVRKQADQESGWCKVRDSALIPACVKIGLVVFKAVISSTVSAATKEEAKA